MMKKRAGKMALVTAGLSAFALALSACGNGSSGGEGAEEIVIGAWAPLTGPGASVSIVQDAMDAYFQDVNDNGGINGHPIRFVVKDDQLNPANTPAAARELAEREGVVMVCGPSGSPTTVAVKDYIDSQNLGVVPAAGSAELIGRTIYLPIPTYTPHGAHVVDYAVNELGLTKIAIAYTDDAVGHPTRDGARWQLEQFGLEPVAEEVYVGTAPDQNALVAKLKDSGAEFVVINQTPAVTSQVFRAADRIDFRPMWGGAWPVLNKTLLELTEGALDEEQIVVSSPFVLGDAPEAESFRESMAKHHPNVDQEDTYTMLGWNIATSCTEVLRRAVDANDGEIPTREQVLEAFPGTVIDDGYVNGLEWTEDDHTGQRKGHIVGFKDGDFVELRPMEDLPAVPEG